MTTINRKKYTSPDGKIQYRKPAIWNNTTPITDGYLEANGWTIEEETIEVHEPPKRYSKLQIMRKLKEAGAWETAKSTIESAEAWDEFLVAQDLSSDDPLFQSLIPVVTALLPEGIDVESILSQCEI
jgi:hypothetical protein